ncbi:uncharacterized protein EAE98_008789 [Botrytis deweyae]|uniref:IBR domain-containing protein n=1 Tax=Botrytis deweyae TaxID=2478750 RepID=A0ABQ7IDG1_9HELO|nr:uncharacterized protein EAE98_008789 [Botrytis deweyae]KAF7920760.1 hypothetical protein EAE98_008789 [Botrytis deweyae]
MTLDTILKNKMRARYISMLWKCCRCEAAPEALPIYLCNALGAESKALSGDWRYPELTCGDTSCATCYRPKTKCSNPECGHGKCYGCPSHDGDINTRNSRVSLEIIGGERFALTFSMGYNCRWQCTESSFPNFNVLEGPEPSIWDRDREDPEPTGQKITRIIPLPKVIANQYLRSEERHTEDETNPQTDLKDKSMADPQLPISRDSPISSDSAIKAAKTILRPTKTSQESPSQVSRGTDIIKNVNSSLDNLEYISKLTYIPINSRNLIVAGVQISGSDSTQIASDFAIAELSSQTTVSDHSKCSEVQGSASTSVTNTPASIPVPSADILTLSSSSQPMALVETESIISDGQSPQNPIVLAENTSEIDPRMKEGATSVEEKRPYYMSGIAGQAVGLQRQLSTAGPTEFESSGKNYSSYSGSTKLASIRPASTRTRTPTRALKLLMRKHRKHPAYSPPPTPPPDSPISPPTPPPENQQVQIVDRILSERLHRPFGSLPNSPSSRWVSLFQETSPQSETPNLSAPAVIPQKRPQSPAIRPAKIIRRQRKL